MTRDEFTPEGPGPGAQPLGHPDGARLLTTEGMRARRHPLAIAALWAWEAALALVVALPIGSLAAAAYGGDPAGDGALWAPGGRALLDLLWREGHGLRTLAALAVPVALLGAVGGLVPLAALMTGIAHARQERGQELDGPPGRVLPLRAAQALGEGVRALPAMALLLLTATTAQALALGLGLGLGQVVEALSRGALGEARAGQLEALALLASAAAVAVVGVVHDLARAAVVLFRVRGAKALLLGLRAFRLSPASSLWSWAWRALASLAPILAAAWAADRLGGRGGAALLSLGVLHQGVAITRVALRTSWLARALRSVDGTLRRVR